MLEEIANRHHDSSKLIIVSLEGCHGCGKTSLCEEFEAQGFRVLDEAFMDMPSYALPPQSLLMETSWVCSWFERVLRLAERLRQEKEKTNRTQVYIADRSPFSAIFYSNNGNLLEPLIKAQMKEVQEFSQVEFITVHVQVEKELLWQRILNRLEEEPERVRFNEHQRSWMEQTLGFYEHFSWDLKIENDKRSIQEIVQQLYTRLSQHSEHFRLAYEQKKMACCENDTSVIFSCSTDTSSSRSSSSSNSDCESETFFSSSQLEEEEEEEEDKIRLSLSPISQKSIIAFNNSISLDDEEHHHYTDF
jgi:thymidylate kinase